MDLITLGWDEARAEQYSSEGLAGSFPARVSRQDRLAYQLLTPEGSFQASCSGRFQHRHKRAADYPVVGDWVVCELDENSGIARIQAVLPRKSVFSRKAAGRAHQEQVVAANIDVLFLVSGLDENFRLRRIERYLAVARQSGAEPVVVLNKADLRDDSEDLRREVEKTAGGAPVVTISALQGDGLDLLRSQLSTGRTAALLGSSGVGKSTILNALMGTLTQDVQENRAGDSRGRHTTTARELFLLPGGGLLVDTPGMRELGIFEADPDLGQSFEGLDELAKGCRFSNCRHEQEPGCAVREAISAGRYEAAYIESWQRLKRERDEAERKLVGIPNKRREREPLASPKGRKKTKRRL